MTDITHKIDLIEGYTDKDGVRHTDVQFGKRLTVGDILALDNDPQAQNPTQYTDLIRRKMIIKFGSMKMPVTLNVLLELNSVDREDLGIAADHFLELGRGGRTHEFRENNVVKLRFGLDVDGTIYDVVHFGKLTTGRDEVEADKLELQGVARTAFMIGRQIEKMSSSEGAATFDGPIDLPMFSGLDAEDFNLLRIGAQMLSASFRLRRAKLQEESDGEEGVSIGKGDGVERKAASGSAD